MREKPSARQASEDVLKSLGIGSVSVEDAQPLPRVAARSTGATWVGSASSAANDRFSTKRRRSDS